MPRFDTPDPISVTLELGVGHISVVASDRTDTLVTVGPSDPTKSSDLTAAERTDIEYTNGVLRVKAPKGWKRPGFRGGIDSINVSIELPTGSQLQGGAGLAALQCTGTLGDCRYKTGAGDITIAHLAGSAELSTGTGAVRVGRIDASATVRNSNGETWIGEAVGDLEVRAANGKIVVGHAHASVTAKTANGDIHLDEVDRGAVVAATSCGRIDVAVRPGVAAWLDLHTGFGRVRNLLDTGAHPGPSEDTVEVRARTSFGDITISRADEGKSGQGAA